MFNKKILLIASLIIANLVHAQQEQVNLTCTSKSLPSVVFNLSFERAADWATHTPPWFTSKINININDVDHEGIIDGSLIGGHTRLTGYGALFINTNNRDILELWLQEHPIFRRASGSGSYLGQELYDISCREE